MNKRLITFSLFVLSFSSLSSVYAAESIESEQAKPTVVSYTKKNVSNSIKSSRLMLKTESAKHEAVESKCLLNNNLPYARTQAE